MASWRFLLVWTIVLIHCSAPHALCGRSISSSQPLSHWRRGRNYHVRRPKHEAGRIHQLNLLTVTSTELDTATATRSTDREPISSLMPDLTLDLEQGNQTEETNQQEYKRGLLTIGFITLLFASNSPVLHTVFSDASISPPVLLINAAVSIVALSGLLFGGEALESNTPLPSTLLQNLEKQSSQDQQLQELKAGAELGLWKFLGTTANIYGLSLTSASHGAFLIQLTTLIVPVAQGIMGVPIPKRIQFSVVLALAGVFLFTQDVISATSVDQGSLVQTIFSQASIGDALCVLAALFYATYDLRLFSWGKQVVPRKLITNKIAAQATFSLGLLATCGGRETADFFASIGDISDIIPLAAMVLWSGVAVNAVAPFLQVGGQQAVGPTRAQTLYASQPLWASIMSYLFLGETIGKQGFVGGGVFLVALGLAATAEAPDPDCGKDNCEVYE